MRASNWKPQKYDAEFFDAGVEKLVQCAEIIADKARQKCPVGTVTRPVGNGKYWQERQPGALQKTIRVTRLYDNRKRNVRVYAGNKTVYYAGFVEMGTVNMTAKPFLRPALNEAKQTIRSILGGTGEF